jgi:hypothetical protein
VRGEEAGDPEGSGGMGANSNIEDEVEQFASCAL